MSLIKKEMMILWFSLMCLTAFPQIKVISSVLNIPTCFLLSEIKAVPAVLHRIKWLYGVIIMMVMASIVLYFSSPHYLETGIQGAISMFEEELIRKYLFIVYGLVCVLGTNSFKTLLNCTYILVVLLTFFALLEILSGHPVFLDIVFQDRDTSNAVEKILSGGDNIGRSRMHSMFLFPFDYGYICVISLMLGWYSLKKKLLSKNKSWIIITCSFFGILVCGCRTVYICTIFATLFYLWIAYDFSHRFQISIVAIIALLASYAVIPYVQDIASLMFSSFQSNNDIEGSSIEMRQIQYETVLNYVQGNFMLGNGKRYFILDLGYLEGSYDVNLRGLEGVVMNLMLERGFFGILVYVVFYLTLLFKVYTYRHIDQVTSACCLSIIVAYIIFANLTGEMGSVPPTLFIIGALLKIIFLRDKFNFKSIK